MIYQLLNRQFSVQQLLTCPPWRIVHYPPVRRGGLLIVSTLVLHSLENEISFSRFNFIKEAFMLTQKQILFLVIIISLPVLAQKRILSNYLNNPNFTVTVSDDSVVNIYDMHNHRQWEKRISVYPESKNTAEANLIIELDTVNFLSYDSYYNQWGYIPAVNSYGSKYVVVDADQDGKNEIYGYGVQYIQEHFFWQPQIYNQVVDSLFTEVYSFPDSGGPFFDVGDITGDGLLDLICASFTGLKFYKQNTPTDLLNNINFIYNPFGPLFYQFNDVTFYDIDGDGN